MYSRRCIAFKYFKKYFACICSAYIDVSIIDGFLRKSPVSLGTASARCADPHSPHRTPAPNLREVESLGTLWPRGTLIRVPLATSSTPSRTQHHRRDYGYWGTSWKRILNPGFQEGSRLNPKYVSNARDFCVIELIALPFIIPGRLTCT